MSARSNNHSYFLLWVVAITFALTTRVDAELIQDSMTFDTSNQSMWAEGAQSTWSGETFLGEKWGTYAGDAPVNASIGGIEGIVENNVCIGAVAWGECIGIETDVDLRLGLEAGINSSGQIGLIPYAKASGGAIDVNLLVNTTITLPDEVSSNEIFNVSTSGGTQNGSTITAEAPSFQGGVDGVFDSNNELYGVACFVGCVSGSVDANLNGGRFELLGFDSSENNPLSVFGVGVPIALFDKQWLIHVPSPTNPDGIDDDVTPQTVPTPVIGNVIFRNPDDASGGSVTGNNLSLQTNQNIFEAKVSITGVIEALLSSPGLLRNEIDIVGPIKANYVIADIAVGPVLGMQQEFGLDPRLMVRLEFDRPVTRMVTQVARYEFETFSGELTVGVGIGRITIELNVLANLDGSADVCVIFQGLKACGGVSAPVGPQSCTSISLAGIAVPVCIPASAVYETVAVVNAQGIVEIAVGQNAELRFDGEVGQLIGRTYYLKDPKFSNRTAATIDPAMQIQLLCAGFTGLGEDKCLFDETFQTTGLTDIFVYNNNWVLGGFEDVEYNDVYRFDGPAKPDDTVAVPEPGTFSLMLLGFALLVLSTVQSRTRTRERKSA